MPTFNVSAQSLAIADPYVIGSAPDNLTGWTQVANPLRVATGTPKYFMGTNANNCIWVYSIPSPVAVFYSRIVLDVFGTDSQGCVVCDSSGVGYQLLVNSSLGSRLFAMTSGGVLGAQKGSTVATSAAAGQVVELEFRVGDPSPGNVRLICRVNSVERINFTEANANTTWYGGGVARGSGKMRSIEFAYTSTYSINTFTDPVIPGAAASGTQTGFANGAITANFGGLTFTGTVSGSALSGTLSSFVDGGLCPLLPAASIAGTFTQSGNTAIINRAISVPSGLRELRDGSNNPANFSGLVLGDAKYLAQPFADAGNPLTTDDRAYWDPAYGLLIDQDGRIRINGPRHLTNPVPSLPYTTTIWIRRGADGRAYSHTLIISEETGAPGEVSIKFLSASNLNCHYLSGSFLTSK